MNRKQVGAWALFDFANSIYPAVVQTAVFSIFYTSVVVGNDEGLGDWWWGRALSTSALIVAISAPLMGAVADRSGVRKRLMFMYTLACLVGVALFTTLGPGMAVQGFIIYVIANVGFEGALVFYNAYLPDIVPRDKQGFVSGLGFGVGYLGSALGLIMALMFVDDMNMVWVSTVLFFAVFSIPTFLFLPKDTRTGMPVGKAAAWGLTHFRTIVGEVMALKDLRRFLLAYFFFIDGINTVIVVAGPFAEHTFGFGRREAILLFLVVQFSALAGAFAMARPTDRLGPKKVLTGSLLLWIGVGLSVYFVRSPGVFFGLAVLVGFGLGSVQAASRAFMSSLTPDGREAEMFGFYAFCGKSSSIVGPSLFGFLAVASGGNQRLAVMALTVLMGAGLLLLRRVSDPKAA
ncbi:MAG TPA: MFS transporter [Longimicrobiales bacterium]|nr:MFS transporter [Longimicrobiales bacterium]